MTLEKLERDYQKKVQNNAKSKEIHKDAFFLGMIAAIYLKDTFKSTGIDEIRKMVEQNVRDNGHEDRLEEVLSYINEEKFEAAVPILAYRCFDYYEKREKEMKEAYDRQVLNATEAKLKAKKNTTPKVETGNKKPAPKAGPQKKKYVVKIHKN